MLSFESDYTEGAHPKILEKFIQTNFEQLPGYGSDDYTKQAKKKIKAACQLPDADVHFLVGGTQTNQIIIDTMLAPYEGVIACQTGHIASHEAGAIEFTGHKVLTLPENLGKMSARDLSQLLQVFYSDENHEHMVFQEWSIFLSQLNMERYILKMNYLQSKLSVKTIKFHYILMAQD